MLKKKLGSEAIERDWSWFITARFKVSHTFVIPEGCKRIGCHTFSGCRELKNVVIPGSMKFIDTSAFCGCYKLEKVVIPESVEAIGYYAFERCKRAVIILRKSKSEFRFIGLDAFKGCKDVKEETGD